MNEPPSVTLTDEQQDVSLEADRLVRLAAEVLAAEGWDDSAEVNLHFVDEARIAELNEAHMGQPGPTDVLSFPIDGEGPEPVPGPVLLGDVVVCPAVADRAAADHAGRTGDELALLVVHGLLHLLGMDHAEPDDRLRMWAAEKRHMDRSWGPLEADPWGTG